MTQRNQGGQVLHRRVDVGESKIEFEIEIYWAILFVKLSGFTRKSLYSRAFTPQSLQHMQHLGASYIGVASTYLL
ncbi:hypothetical protein GWN42_02765 [candidate division KSB1 bacterium]|nr:hypothetical protein [candidate division KSB1 bacterium]NIS22566.1 hypothetical protein [candidate division KSB1 bacterium]NIU23064.1 hypothetical protein [candidate division KSB1 bacterium]NIU92135.1 hypothetical protein [candidate division KSB1 bacterium]NIV91734.1 hypothetical protein [candidate division KSB1 bacterium]